jgi:cyclase
MNIKKLILFLFIFQSRTSSIFAKSNPDIFIFSKVTNHVYIAHPGPVKRINSTTTIIVGQNFLTVVESQTDVFMAAALIRGIRQRISKLPIKYLIFTHFHLDHILGAEAFLRENPALIIIAHQNTAEHIALHGINEQTSWVATIKQKSMEAKQSAISAETQQKREYFMKASSELDAYYKDVQSSVIVPPNLTFRDSLNLHDENLQLQLVFLGAGHTAGDIVVWIPQDKVLVTGDLVHDYEPLFWDADPDSWVKVLEKIKQIDFDYFVGGHGDMHEGKEIVYAWQSYMQELITKTKGAMNEGLTLETFQKEITIETFHSLQNGYGVRIQKFRTGYMEYLTGPLIDAIRGEIAFVWKFYETGH